MNQLSIIICLSVCPSVCLWHPQQHQALVDVMTRRLLLGYYPVYRSVNQSINQSIN